jgi:hypothetical protein
VNAKGLIFLFVGQPAIGAQAFPIQDLRDITGNVAVTVRALAVQPNRAGFDPAIHPIPSGEQFQVILSQ